MQRICVFCGSSSGGRVEYRVAAIALAGALADRGSDLVYGGGRVGLMGVLADAMLARGRNVIGVIPESLRALEVAHEGLADLRVVASMHERKALMADLSDAFIALPGGIGTLEEIFEVLTWAQLGLHAKPIGLLNVCGYFDPLLAFLERAERERFLRAEHRSLLRVGDDAQRLLNDLATVRPAPSLEKWIDRDER